MKKAKGEDDYNSIDRISELPQAILQRMMYFLSQKEAVRTSVLSKSWRYIWCARPNLHLSDDTFKGKKDKFISVVNNALQRYWDQRLCLEEFHLCISLLGKDHSEDNYDLKLILLLEKWISLLTCMGVKEFHLLVIAEHSFRGIIHLPVVLKAEPLKLLHLNNCNLGQNIPENIPFVRLQELKLCNVLIKKEIFDKIISSCPLLTTIFFMKCKGLQTIKLKKKLHKYLKSFTFINRTAHDTEECTIEIDVPTLEEIKIIGSKIRFHILKFSNLKSLYLEEVEISSNLAEQSQLCIDAPSIICFEYAGFFVPSTSFTPTLSKSKLQLIIHDDINDAQSWFLRLSQQLQALRQSKIYLCLGQSSRDNLHIEEDILVQDMINVGNRPVVVDRLRLYIGHISSIPYFLHGLFCISRPRNIYPCWIPRGHWDKEMEVKELGELFCKIQMMRESGNQEIWRYLEDLTIEGSDESRKTWQTLQVAELSQSALSDFDRFRLRLQWSDQDL